MLKTVTQEISTYAISIFLFPKEIFYGIERIMNSYGGAAMGERGKEFYGCIGIIFVMGVLVLEDFKNSILQCLAIKKVGPSCI